MGAEEPWREVRRALSQGASILGAVLMTVLLVYGLWHTVPDRRAAEALEEGRKSLKRGDYGAAKRDYDAALSLAPTSAVARQGLACAYYISGSRSIAALELSKGLEVGVFAEMLGHCGHGLDLDDVFFTAKLGLSDAFAVPRVANARRFEDALRAEPTGTTAEEPERMLLGACLAQRAGLAGTTWSYAGNAIDTGAVDGPDERTFLACLGPNEQRRAGCADSPSIRSCSLTPTAREAYFRESRLVNAPSRQHM